MNELQQQISQIREKYQVRLENYKQGVKELEDTLAQFDSSEPEYAEFQAELRTERKKVILLAGIINDLTPLLTQY